jgi:ubiquinone/menaquinone biosynthesis C-methylase UbiE
MSNSLASVKLKAEKAYNAAAELFDAEPLAFWNRHGRRTIERMSLRRGAHVLDVCCGTGASALPAAQAVGPGGKVIAVDLAGELLKLGQAKARAAGLQSLEFRRGDMTSLGFPDGHFDAVVCVFGIFFVPDMEAQVAELWRMVRPGGRLEVVRHMRPDLHIAFNPWDRITTTEAVRRLLQNGGAQNVEVDAEDGYQTLRTPEDFWTIALGSGLRWTIDQMGTELAREVKQELLDRLSADGITRIETNAIYAVAEKQLDTL